VITEIAELTIDPEASEAFESAVAEARELFLQAPDCHSFRIDRVVETPGTYLLLVGWTSVEAHMERFRSSDAFQRWRALVSPFFIAPPAVRHTETVL